MNRASEVVALKGALGAFLLACAGLGGAGCLRPPAPAAATGLAHGATVQSLAFAADGQRLAVGGGFSTTGEQVCVWDTASGRVRATFTAHRGPVLGLAFPGGRVLTAGFDGAKFWDASGEFLRAFPAACRDAPVVALSGDGRRLAVAGGPSAVQLWDLATSRSVAVAVAAEDIVGGVALSPAGDFAAASTNLAWLWVWDARTGEERLRVRRAGAPGMALAVAAGAAQVACGLSDGTIEVWDVVRRKSAAVARGHDGLVVCVAYSPDGSLLASGGEDRTVRLWDAATGQALGVLGEHSDRVNALAFDAAGRRLASGSQDGAVRVWDVPAAGR